MDDFPPYRQLLLESLIIIEDSFCGLASLAIDFVFCEDLRNGTLPFENGDRIPIDLCLFEASDIVEVRIMHELMLPLIDIDAYLKNIYNINDEEKDDFCATSDEPSLGFEVEGKDDFEYLQKVLLHMLRITACRMLSQCYDLIFRADRSKIPACGFLKPSKQDLALLRTSDPSIQKLLDLAKLTLEKRELLLLLYAA